MTRGLPLRCSPVHSPQQPLFVFHQEVPRLASLCVGELFTQQIRANGREEAAVTPPVFVMRRKHVWCSRSCLKKRFCSLGAGISHQILAPAPDHLLDACLAEKYAPLKHINGFILHLLLCFQHSLEKYLWERFSLFFFFLLTTVEVHSKLCNRVTSCLGARGELSWWQWITLVVGSSGA